MKRAAIYGRKSTNKQSAETIETQINECKKWAAENDCQIVAIYDDSGQSGQAYNVGNRDGFHQIREDAKRGLIDIALIHKIDRFARSVADYFIQERELNKYGVKIIVVGMPFFQNADIITKSVHIAVAEQFSVNLSEDVSVKMRTFARKGAFLGGKPPYGFNVQETENGKQLVIDAEKARGIKLLYKSYLAGFGYIQTARILAENGFLNEKNEPFTPTFIRSALTNKKYNGYYVFGLRETIDGKENFTKDKDKIVEIPDVYPKIIDDVTFNAAQEQLKERKTYNKRKARDYPLTGLVTCGECGRAFTGSCTVQEKRNVKRYVYYKCTGCRVGVCDMVGIRADYLEDFISEKLKKHAFNDEFTARLIAEIEKNLSGDVQAFKSLKTDIQRDLTAVNNQIKEATKDKYAKKINDELYGEIIEELNDKKTGLEMRLNNIMQQLNINDKTREIKNYVKWLKNNLEKADDDIKGALLRQTVHEVIVYKDRIEIYIYMTTPPPRGNRRYYSPSNITRGVPLLTIDKKGAVILENGLSLFRVTLGRVSDFNINGK